MSTERASSCWRRTCFLLAAWLLAAPAFADEDARKPRYPRPPSDKNVRLAPQAWEDSPVRKLSPAELDRLLAAGQKADKVRLATRIGDGGFLRRVFLDVAGKLPTPREVRDFLADESPDKRARIIDKLLDSDDFARHRAHYWRGVILSRATDNRGFLKLARESSLETWLFERFKHNSGWDQTARALISSDGTLSIKDPSQGGDVAMLLCHTGADGPVERTNDTARIFLGINLQCAQCHDHPDDIWKRRQFHEMAAFYGRLTERYRFERQPSEGKQPMVANIHISLASKPAGDYRMPDRDDPTKTVAVEPRFLFGQTLEANRSDWVRRKSLAGFITARDNYYFSAAFVNRVWSELMGQAFVTPVDNLGPLQPAVYSDVLLGLSLSFRASDFDVKELYRLILNTRAYQRRLRMGESPGDHVKFAGVYPTRLRGDALWESLAAVLEIKDPPQATGGPFRQRFSASVLFKEMFDYDPSARPEDVEESVPQALMLMNNKGINARIKAFGNTPLARILKTFPTNGNAVDQVYLKALSRMPTVREKRICLEHIRDVGKRGPAFEDILWALINSAEFRTKR
jgi:hypothetical protein